MGRSKRVVLTMIMAAVFLAVMGRSEVFAGSEDHHFEIGPEIYYFNYEEPGVMEEDGFMYGIYGKYQFRRDSVAHIDSWETFVNNFNKNTSVSIDARVAYGQVDYESTSTGTIDDIDDLSSEVRTTAGYDFPIFEETLLMPYAGFGFRYHKDDLGGKVSTTGHAGYKRESHYLYVPLGVETLTKLDDRWSLGFNFEYDIFITGEQESHLEDVSPLLNTVENDQEDGYGLRGGVKVIRRGENIDLSFEGFARYWDIDESQTAIITCGATPCALGYEPKNDTLESGVRVGVLF